LSKFWFSLGAEFKHQRLQDFGSEAFFVDVPRHVDNSKLVAMVTPHDNHPRG
jgi:hypothetical protein